MKNNAQAICFFSGGVDSFYSLISHRDEEPILLSIWGSDIQLSDVEGWNNIVKIINSTANIFNLKSHKIKSSFRYFLDQGKLSRKVKKSGDGWWHGFQHGIGVISHVAPIAWLYKSQICYIASSHSKKDLVSLPIASHPSIDEKFNFANTQIVHDGFEKSRQDKIDTIVASKNNNIKLHVCWQSSGGSNCNKCEKCLRTILGIIVSGGNPEDFGLHYDPSNMKFLKKILNKKILDLQYLLLLNVYFDTQKAFINRHIEYKYPELSWFNKIEIEKILTESKTSSKFKRLIKIIRNLIFKCLYKLNKIFFKQY